MNISFEKNGNVSAAITINIEKPDYEERVAKAIKALSHKVNMPGFRPGKVPVGLVKKMYGTSVKAEEINKMLGESLYEYIRENKVNILGEPLPVENDTPIDMEKDESMSFGFEVALSPEFEATLSAEDNIDYYDITVADEDVDAKVNELASRHGHTESVEEFSGRDLLRGDLTECVEGGISSLAVSIMPEYLANDEQKALFQGAKKGDVITFNPAAAYEGREAELASLLGIKKEEVAEHKGDFTYQITEISHFVPAELNQEFFDKIYGEGNVKSEEELRAKVRSELEAMQVADSDYKFLVDLRKYLEDKVGTLTFANDILRRVMRANYPDKSDEDIEKGFDQSLVELKWHLIKEKLVAANNLKVEDKDLKAMALQATKFQFAQYGITNVPDEYLENYAAEMLKKKEQVDSLVNRCIETKIVEAAKNVVTLNHKSVSREDFMKLFENNDAEQEA